ncbi:MAG: BT4734/BF3469 family protein [Patescibacteria group bacterium]
MSILNKIVSYFPSVTATTQGVEVNLLDLLQSNKHKERILNLRQSEKELQKKLKEKLPCYTPAGTFSRRCEKGLIKLSGLAAVDLDAAEDYDIIYLLNQLKKCPYIAYAGLSCRGQRLFCIVPFKYPDKYEKQYEELIRSFERMGLPMGDECHKQISQPRFVSWNDENTHFFNHDAKPYHLLPVERTYPLIKPNYQKKRAATVQNNTFHWCLEQINKSYSFSEGARNNYIIHLARYCNMKGLPEDETLNGCLQFIQTDFPEAEIKKIVSHIYIKQADSHAKLLLKPKAQNFDYRAFKQPEQPEHQPKAFKQPNLPEKSSKPEEIETVKETPQISESNTGLIEKPRKPDILTNVAFMGKSGNLYVQNFKDANIYRVYNDVKTYNARLEIPKELSKQEAFEDFKTWIELNTKPYYWIK